MYKREKELLNHYNSNVNYSSVNVESFFKNFEHIDFKRKRILDLGCGDGRFCRYAKDILHSSTFGVDFSIERIKKARSLDSSINFFCMDCYQYAEEYDVEKWGLFDMVLMTEVIEHLEDPSRLSFALSKISKTIFGSVPLNFPYVAHLQVFRDEEEFKSFFKEWDMETKIVNKNIFFYGKVKG